MTTPHASTTTPTDPAAGSNPSVPVVRPSIPRRVAVATTAFLTLALPTMFTVNITRMLLTGVETDHRFHQATGQGLILFALWLGALVPLVRAGWRGRRPSAGAGWRHLVLVVSGAACAAAAPGGGAPVLVGVIAVTGALLWWALPVRPSLRVSVRLDPVLAPVALLAAAFFTPYVVDQLALQNAATGHHAQNPHFFDMAWISVALVALAALSATLPAVRSLSWWVGGSVLALGAAGLAFGEPTAWSLLALALGVAATAVALVAPRGTAFADR